MNAELEDAGVIYDVRPKFPGSHLFVVSTRVNAPAAEGQEFSLPAWIPGSYMIRDFARHVVTISATANGNDVALTKIDKSTWRAAPASGSLLIEAEIYANDLSVRGAFLDLDHGFLNGVCLFFRIHGQDQLLSGRRSTRARWVGSSAEGEISLHFNLRFRSFYNSNHQEQHFAGSTFLSR